MIDVDNICLGKRPGWVEDDRHFKLRSFFTALESPPASWEIAVNLEETDGWGLYANDRLGDCTCAARAHGVNAMEWNSGQRNREPLKITTAQVIEAYKRVGGYVPGDESTDNGAYLVDNVKDWRSIGLGRESDGTPHVIYAYAKTDLITSYARSLEFRAASRLFGGAYVGLALPSSAADEIRGGRRWEKTTDAPYSWGGHAVWIKGWDQYGLTCVTWGAEQRMTWAWAAKYLDESWAVISEDYLNRLGRTQQGLNVDQLRDRIRSL